MPDGILIDQRGIAWADNSWQLAQQIGYRDASIDVPTYAVRDRGFIHLRPQDGGVRVAVHAGTLKRAALAGALYAIKERHAPRILLAVLSHGEWSYEIFTSLWDFAERAEDLAAGAPATARSPWLAMDRNLKALTSPSFAMVRPIVRLWEETRGRLGDDLPRALGMLGLQPRTVLVRQPSGSSRLIVEHFGAGIKFMRPCDTLLRIGHDFEDLPDREYGQWAARAYAETLASRRLRLESVRALIRTSEAATIRTRYDRLLMPWWRGGNDLFVLAVSIKRVISPVA